MVTITESSAPRVRPRSVHPIAREEPTMTIHPQQNLADIVTRYPSIARELEIRGLDYCCGGTTSLELACRANGLDPVIVASELAAAATDDAPAAWSTMGVVQLVDHIDVVHHRYLWDELPRLSALMDKVLGAHGDRHRELVEVASCLVELRADLEPHMNREEQVLFPAIRELATAGELPTFRFGSIRNPISKMLREHDTVGELLQRLRRLTGDYDAPADGCASYHALYRALAELEADTHLHVHKENNALFPAVVDLERRLSP
jgi:regulator of cell morphogenesis and NO signaling